MNPIRVGLIGSGFVAELHMNAYQRVYGVDAVVKAVASRGDHVLEFAKRRRIPTVYRDYRELLQDKEIDVVDICTPAVLHAPMIVEAMAAGKVLGVEHFHFWEEPDGSLQDVPALAARMGELIRTIQPDAVFCPDPWAQYEAHFDHIVTGRAAAQAFIASSLMAYPRGTQTAPWTCKALGFYFTQAPNTIVDVTDTLEAKFAAMAEHRTQLDDESLGLYKIYFGMQAQKLGAQKGYALGEGFKVLSGMHLHCFAEAPGI